MDDKKLEISIVTPAGIHSQVQADVLMANTADGQIGILPDHAPLITMLTHGELIIKHGQETTLLATGAGVLEVNNSAVTVLVDSADKVDELDEIKILEAKKRAEAIMAEQKESPTDFAKAQNDFRKSLNQLNSVRKWKKMKA